MRKQFQVDGYAVNGRGNTVGIHYTVTATGRQNAISVAMEQAGKDGYKHIRITRTVEARHIPAADISFRIAQGMQIKT